MNILVVDDNKLMREMISAMVTACEHTPFKVSGYESAIETLENQSIDLVLMDIEMPEMNGFELTRLLREKYQDWFPIIFLSANDSEGYLAEGIDAGGDDYLTKPVSQTILSAKLKAMSRIADMQKELDKVNQQLAKLSNIDPLTQIANRRGMDDFLAKAWQINHRESSALSVLMIDLDHFKLYNDNYGHQKGDDCLIAFAQLLSDNINSDTEGVFRYGGEEFIVVLPFTNVNDAFIKAQHLLSKLEELAIEHNFSPTNNKITASIGVASTEHMPSSFLELMSNADKALYLAKEKGRNRSVIFQKD